MLAHLKIWLKTQIKKSAGQPSAKWGLLSDILNSDHKWQRFHQHNPWKHLLNRFQYCWILLLRPMCDISTTTRCIWAPSSFIRPCPTPGDKRKRYMWWCDNHPSFEAETRWQWTIVQCYGRNDNERYSPKYWLWTWFTNELISMLHRSGQAPQLCNPSIFKMASPL